jgi:hypothetical protein
MIYYHDTLCPARLEKRTKVSRDLTQQGLSQPPPLCMSTLLATNPHFCLPFLVTIALPDLDAPVTMAGIYSEWAASDNEA